MTKLHKDIAMRLMESVQDDGLSDQAVIKVNKSSYIMIHSKLIYIQYNARSTCLMYVCRIKGLFSALLLNNTDIVHCTYKVCFTLS